MKRIILFCCFLFPLMAFSAENNGIVTSINKIPHGGVVLNKGWKFHAGDNKNWAKKGIDDSNWEDIDPSKDIYFLPQVRNAEIGWFRLRLKINPSLFNKTLGLMVYQTGASDIYVNGRLAYHLGQVVNDGKTRSLRFYDEQLSIMLDTGRIQEIAVRFSCGSNDFIVNYLTPNYCEKLVLTNVNELLGNYISETTSYLIKDYILITLYVFLGVISLFLYFSYRVQRAYLFFGYYCFASIVQALLRIPTYAVKPVNLSLASACFLSSHIVSILAIGLLLAGLYKLYGQKKSILFYFLIFYAISSLPVFKLFYSFSNIYAVSFGLFMCIDAAIISFRAISKGFSNALVLFITFIVFFLTFISFMAIAAAGNINLGLNIAGASLLIIPFGLSIFLATEFARTGKDLQVRMIEVERLSEKAILSEQEKQQILALQNETLETQVAERTTALNQSLNHLKATQNQLIQSEKMASLGELTAGIAHEIQNPLNFVNNFSEVSIELLEELQEEAKAGHTDDVIEIAADLTQNLQKINHHGKRADSIVKGMLEHSRIATGEKELTDVNQLADEFFKLTYHGLRAKDKSFNAELITDFDNSLPKIDVIPQDIGRVLLNLFNNAFYAVNQKQKTGGADYKPVVSVSTSSANGQVIIVIKDNGTGIPDAIKEKIMQPFFTTKPTGEGTGLGLSLSYDIVVKGHNGTLGIISKEGEGAGFIVKLPLN